MELIFQPQRGLLCTEVSNHGVKVFWSELFRRRLPKYSGQYSENVMSINKMNYHRFLFIQAASISSFKKDVAMFMNIRKRKYVTNVL